MNQDKQQQLIAKFPRVFCKLQHLECGEGWYTLLEHLFSLIDNIITYLPEELQDSIYAVQVKEKFGTLRVYMENSTPYIEGAIAMAESLSGKICERCGMPGECRTGGWIRTLCNLHAEERNNKV